MGVRDPRPAGRRPRAARRRRVEMRPTRGGASGGGACAGGRRRLGVPSRTRADAGAADGARRGRARARGGPAEPGVRALRPRAGAPAGRGGRAVGAARPDKVVLRATCPACGGDHGRVGRRCPDPAAQRPPHAERHAGGPGGRRRALRRRTGGDRRRVVRRGRRGCRWPTSRCRPPSTRRASAAGSAVDAVERALARAWVRKEATLKALGTGLTSRAGGLELRRPPRGVRGVDAVATGGVAPWPTCGSAPAGVGAVAVVAPELAGPSGPPGGGGAGWSSGATTARSCSPHAGGDRGAGPGRSARARRAPAGSGRSSQRVSTRSTSSASACATGRRGVLGDQLAEVGRRHGAAPVPAGPGAHEIPEGSVPDGAPQRVQGQRAALVHTVVEEVRGRRVGTARGPAAGASSDARCRSAEGVGRRAAGGLRPEPLRVAGEALVEPDVLPGRAPRRRCRTTGAPARAGPAARRRCRRAGGWTRRPPCPAPRPGSPARRP